MTAIALKCAATLQTRRAIRRPAVGRPSLRRHPLGPRLETAAVLSLFGSSAAYAVLALARLG